MDGTLIGSTTPGESLPESNVSKEVLHNSQSPETNHQL